ILCIRITAKAHQAGIRLTPKQLFQHQTIAGVASVAELSPVAPAAEQEVIIGHVPLTPIQPQTNLCTPSDFPLANLDQATLERLRAGVPLIEDIYPLSALQQGLLFNTLQDLSERRSDVGFSYLSCNFQGELDAATFRRAWQEVIQRHSILRTSFAWQGLDAPL